MANPEHVEIVGAGAEAIDEWRTAHPGERLNLQEADLREANLCNADLKDANLNGANLRGATLSMTNLSFATLGDADLSRADLSGAELAGVDLGFADLKEADLSRSNLNGATLDHTNLSHADLSFAWLGSTLLANTDLSNVTGLTSVRHQAPSTVGIDTIYRSRGEIPDEFLRGCGVPEDMIAFARSISGAIDFYSCFISYSHKDEDFARRLRARMGQVELRVWFAAEDMPGGKKLHEEIDRAIRLHDKLLVVLSPNSMNSEWVATEIRKARNRELKERRRVLFPIRLVPFDAIREWKLFDADSAKDLAVELREYYIPDFSNWKDHNAFEKEFQKLLRDLQKSEERS